MFPCLLILIYATKDVTCEVLLNHIKKKHLAHQFQPHVSGKLDRPIEPKRCNGKMLVLAWKFFSHLREVLTITLSKVIGVIDAGNKEAQSIPTVDRMELTKLSRNLGHKESNNSGLYGGA